MFHRTDNKAKLFSTLMSARSVNTRSLPGDVIMHNSTRCDVDALVKGTVQSNTTAQRTQKEQQQKQRQRSSARSNNSRVYATTSCHHSTPEGAPRWIPGPSNFHQVFHHQQQQPTTSRANATAPTANQFQPSQQPTFAGAPGMGMPVPSTAFLQQLQQLVSVGAPGTGMSVPPAAFFQQPQQLISAGAPGTGMSAPPAAYFQQPQQLASAGAPSTAMPVPYAGMQGSTISQLHQSQQLMSVGFVGAGMPAPGLLPQQATSNFTLSTANLPAHHPNTFISPSFPVPTSLRRQIIDGNYINLAILIMPSLHQLNPDRYIGYKGYEGCPHSKWRAPICSRELKQGSHCLGQVKFKTF